MTKRTAFFALALAGIWMPARGSSLNNPNGCQPAVVAPCYIATQAGPLLITDPSQVSFSIGLAVNGALTGSDSGGDQAIYSDPNGDLAADPDPIRAQNLAAVTALLNSGMPVLAPNPGGSAVVTNSVSSYVSGFVDTPVSQRVDQYSTTIEAVLNGGTILLDQTFALPFSDPVVQAAVTLADSILAGDNATFGIPQLAANSTTLTGSQTAYTVTGQSATGTLVSTVVTFGPASIAVGDNLSELFTILAGQTDINVNTEILYVTDRNAVTTSTYLTSQTYEIDGATQQVSAAPEPSGWWLSLVSLTVLGLLRRCVVVRGLEWFGRR